MHLNLSGLAVDNICKFTFICLFLSSAGGAVGRTLESNTGVYVSNQAGDNLCDKNAAVAQA